MKQYFIGIDLGGTKISSAISLRDGSIIDKIVVETKAELGQKAVMDRIFIVIDKLLQRTNISITDICAIGIGSPGPLDSKSGIIITTPNLPFKNFNIVSELKNRYNVPIYLDNDANVGCIGEYKFGAGIGYKNIIYITVSTGIGAGAILGGQPYRGSTSNALEIGHTTVKPDGLLCNCGNNGCLEAISSGTAIAKAAKEAIKVNSDTSLSKYSNITSYEVFKEASCGDNLSVQVVNNALNYLGIGVANVISIFDPDIVIIGGGVSNAGEVLFDAVREVVKKRCFKAMSDNCIITKAKLGNDSGIIGALALAITEYNNIYFK